MPSSHRHRKLPRFAVQPSATSTSRHGRLAVVVALSMFALGCNACGTPFDYCSPTFGLYGRSPEDCGDGCGDSCGDGCDEGCDDCRENVRLGSILSDRSLSQMSYNEPVDDDVSDQQPTPAEELPPPADEQTLPGLLPPADRPSLDDPTIDDEEMPLPDLNEEPSLEEDPSLLEPATYRQPRGRAARFRR
jgi:hypothetical protein